MTSLKVDVKISSNTGDFGTGISCKLFIQTGTGWTWADNGPVELSNNTESTLILDLRLLNDLDLVQAIGVEFQIGSGCNGDAAFYIDNVRVE